MRRRRPSSVCTLDPTSINRSSLIVPRWLLHGPGVAIRLTLWFCSLRKSWLEGGLCEAGLKRRASLAGTVA